ncbi:MAG TPA: hypothetical protein DCL61_12225, partial [Cyanobacteria bacterium UBA12227]|nr:hypothetical protein [Cyanobacteria bacterium UBA12227]
MVGADLRFQQLVTSTTLLCLSWSSIAVAEEGLTFQGLQMESVTGDQIELHSNEIVETDTQTRGRGDAEKINRLPIKNATGYQSQSEKSLVDNPKNSDGYNSLSSPSPPLPI